MMYNYFVYVVALHRFTRSHIVKGIFLNEASAFHFKNTYCPTARIFCCYPSDLIFNDFGVELRKGLSPM